MAEKEGEKKVGNTLSERCWSRIKAILGNLGQHRGGQWQWLRRLEGRDTDQPRDQREFSIPGILARISFIFSRSTMRFHFVILVPFSKHEILKEKILFSSRTPRFIRQKSRLVSKLEIFKKIFSISSRTTRFRETKISISSQKIHISRCILLIII